MAELVWPGKYVDGTRSLPDVSAATTRPRWTFGADRGHRVLRGDNLGALDALLADLEGAVDLVYIDPPFATGGRFSVQTRVGMPKNGRSPPEIEAPAYSDRFEGGLDGFLAMLDVRLRRIHALLSPRGSFYIHVDPTVGHAVKMLCDEVFGAGCFQRELVWRIGWVSGFKTRARNWIRNHDLIFFYTKDPGNFTFNKHYVPYPPGYTRRDGSPPKGAGMPIDDVWNANETEFSLRGRDSLDSIQIKSFSNEKSGYATQKNESLLRRIVEASSNPGDLVLDAFCGSGTTGVAAAATGRRFIGCDVNEPAVHITLKRLLDADAGPVAIEDVISAPESESESESEPRPATVSSGPKALFEVERRADGFAVTLVGYQDPDPSSWPDALRKLEPSGLDLVDAWWVGTRGEGGTIAVEGWSTRTHQRRELHAVLVAPTARRLVATVVDVLYRVTEVELEIGL